MHRGDIERSDAHFAGDIQIKLLFVQISVFAHVKSTIVILIDFFFSEVLTGSGCRSIGLLVYHALLAL